MPIFAEVISSRIYPSYLLLLFSAYFAASNYSLSYFLSHLFPAINFIQSELATESKRLSHSGKLIYDARPTINYLLTCTIINKNTDISTPKIPLHKRSKFLLPSSIPQLNSIFIIFKFDIFSQVIHPYSRLQIFLILPSNKSINDG